MSKPYIKIVRDVFSSRNILTIAITTSMMDICMSGWRPFWGLYLTNELGATIGALGLMSTIQLSLPMISTCPECGATLLVNTEISLYYHCDQCGHVWDEFRRQIRVRHQEKFAY